MKLAIMQPYLFPYIGYFQLLNAVNKFLIYDDVSYIKKGWINRNNILSNNSSFLFTIPLLEASQNKLICDVMVNDVSFGAWKDKFMRTLSQSYSKATNVHAVLDLVSDVISRAPGQNIGHVALDSIVSVHKYLGIQSEIIYSSKKYENNNMSGQYRILDICCKESADIYINPIGGMELYDKNKFIENKIELFFIKPNLIEYKQLKNGFVPGLSIIDVLMFNSINDTKLLLNEYELI